MSCCMSIHIIYFTACSGLSVKIRAIPRGNTFLFISVIKIWLIIDSAMLRNIRGCKSSYTTGKNKQQENKKNRFSKVRSDYLKISFIFVFILSL